MDDNATGIKTEDLIIELGQQIQAARLDLNTTQSQLAKSANISLRALIKLEQGNNVTIETYVRVLRALGKMNWLLSMRPKLEVDPLELLKAKKRTAAKTRRRATGDKA